MNLSQLWKNWTRSKRTPPPSPESISSPQAPADDPSVLLSKAIENLVVIDGTVYESLPSALPFGFTQHRAFMDRLFQNASIDDIGDDVVLRVPRRDWDSSMAMHNDEFIRQMFLP